MSARCTFIKRYIEAGQSLSVDLSWVGGLGLVEGIRFRIGDMC